MDLVRELIRGQYALTEHHHRSYEAFVAAVPQMIRRRNPILFAPEVEGEPYEVRVWIGGQNGRLDLVRASDGRDTPAEARAGGRTYALQIVADVKIVMRLGARESSRTLRDVAMGEIPLMVRSTRCAYRDGSAPDPEPEDPGGYFVVDGAEKVAVTQLDIAPNVVNFRRPKDGRTLAGAAHTWRVDIQAESFDRENYGVVHFSVWTEDPAQGGRQFLTFDSPVLSSARGHAELADLFAAYGVESDEDIERLVFPDDRERARMADWLRPTLARRTAFTAAEAQELLSPPSAANAGADMRREWVLQVLANQELRFRARAVLLAHQVREIALVTNGVLEPPTREHLSQARAYAAGLLFETLFFSVYRDLAQRIRQRIEKEYRELVVRSPQALLGLVSPVNQGAVLRGRDITEAFVQNMKTTFERANDDHSGVVQSLNRLSWLGTLAHLRRLSKPIDRTLNVFEPHLLRLDGGVPGRLCPNHTPDGPNVGYILNLAITATISPGGPPSEAMRALLREAEADGVFVPVARIGLRSGAFADPRVIVNGAFWGTTRDAPALHRRLRDARRAGRLPPFESLALRHELGRLEIWTDAGRIVRPLIVVEDGKVPDLGRGIRALLASGEAEYLDTNEEITAVVAAWPGDVHAGHTHLELHPIAAYSVVSASIPLVNHAPAPRIGFACSQLAQAVSVYAPGDISRRLDAVAYIARHVNRPAVTSGLERELRLDDLGDCSTLVVAITPADGQNIEDAVVLNADAVARGLFQATATKTVVFQEDRDEATGTTLRLAPAPPPGVLREGVDRSGLAPTGVVREGTPVPRGARVALVQAVERGADGTLRDATVYSSYSLHGEVETVSFARNPRTGLATVQVKVREHREVSLGDKLCGRGNGQKGTVGSILPGDRMIYSAETGMRPDLVWSPHGFPTRMTVSYLLEGLLAKAGVPAQLRARAEAFGERPYDDVGEALRALGFDASGEEAFVDPGSGRVVRGQLFSVPLSYVRLKHMVADKHQARGGDGPVDPVTRQPEKGRARGGGLRCGEMERDALIASGVAAMVSQVFRDPRESILSSVCPVCGLLRGTRARPARCLCRAPPPPLPARVPAVMVGLAWRLAALGVLMHLRPAGDSAPLPPVGDSAPQDGGAPGLLAECGVSLIPSTQC